MMSKASVLRGASPPRAAKPTPVIRICTCICMFTLPSFAKRRHRTYETSSTIAVPRQGYASAYHVDLIGVPPAHPLPTPTAFPFALPRPRNSSRARTQRQSRTHDPH